MTQKAVSVEKVKKARIRLGTYPYTYARTCVMRSTLLRPGDYDKMLKMTVNEIAGFLQDNAYRKEISELGSKLSGAKLIEVALNRNLEDTFAKMRRISNKKALLKVIDAYLMRYDVRNIKNVLRAKYTHSENFEDFIIAGGMYGREFFMNLLKKDSIEDILKCNCILPFSAFTDALKAFKESNVLGEIENVFEREYYRQLFELSEAIPNQGKFFREFLEGEVEITNILNILRLKRAGVDERSASKFLLPVKRTSVSLFSKMITAEPAKCVDIFKGTPYEKIMAENIKKFQDTGSLIGLETCLWNYLLNKTKTLVHQHPLSVDIIAGFILAKDMEARNIKLIVKGKQLGLGNDFIESQLVI
jgi:V/A-type H+/Na+-transporting ATPase subunit C